MAWAVGVLAAGTPAADDPWQSGNFSWTAGAPLVAAVPAVDRSVAIKDPTVVFDGGRWHLYATIKPDKPATMEYMNFKDWPSAGAAPRRVVSLVDSYHCAPQIFHFRPQRRWYLLYQWNDKTNNFFGPAYSTLDDVSKPETLTRPVMLFPRKPEHVPHWIDFWVICDEARAWLFFTGDDGRFWRSGTALADFPAGWSRPELALQAGANELFEASHTYRLKGTGKFLTLIEAIGPGGQRYYKAWLADRLDGEWRALAASWEHPFASSRNVRFAPGVEPWTDSISHGELLRDGIDETLSVDPAHLRFLFQGCSAKERTGKGYGQLPWRLGMLELETSR